MQPQGKRQQLNWQFLPVTKLKIKPGSAHLNATTNVAAHTSSSGVPGRKGAFSVKKAPFIFD
jgi:hypothetical protein